MILWREGSFMVQTGVTVNQLPDLPAALQMIEEKTGSRPGGTEEKTLCRLLSEELLMHLLRAGYTGIRVSVRNLGSRAVMLTAPGEPDTLFTDQPGERAGGDAEETEVEINRNILGEFDGNIDYRYRRDQNIYTIYPGQKDSARITDEILDYYETENDGGKGPVWPSALPCAQTPGHGGGRLAASPCAPSGGAVPAGLCLEYHPGLQRFACLLHAGDRTKSAVFGAGPGDQPDLRHP